MECPFNKQLLVNRSVEEDILDNYPLKIGTKESLVGSFFFLHPIKQKKNMFEDISTNSNFPKTLLIRNTPEGMIWQIYHVDNFIQANYLSINASSNGFKGITLVDYQPGTETFPNWRMELARAFVNTLPDYITLKEGVKDVPVEEYNYDDY